MALTKARTSLYAAQTLTAGGGPTNSAWQDVTGAYAAIVCIKLTNATGLTVGATFKVEAGGVASPTYTYDVTPTYQHSIVNSDIKSWTIELPQAAMYFRISVTHPTGGNATLEVEFTEVTAL